MEAASLTTTDEQLQRWVVTHRVEVLDSLFVALSHLGTLGFVWLVAGLLAALAWRRPEVVALVAVAVAASDLTALGLKTVTGRPRPYVRVPEPEPLLHPALGLSLPSGHAATSFAAAVVLARVAPRLAAPLFLLAAGIAWSRVYVGVHYPSDVVLGALLGLAVGAAVMLAYGRVRGGATAPRPPGAGRRRSPPARPRG